MKKTYINPEMEAIKLESIQLLQISAEVLPDEITDESQIGSRFDDFWDI